MHPAVTHAQHTRERIAQDTPRTTGPLLARLSKTLLPALLVFVVTMLASGYLRVYLDAEFQDSGLNTLTAISTSLLILVLTWAALRWTESRFQGIGGMRRMGRMVTQMRLLERGIENADTADEAMLDELDQLAGQTWQDYQVFVAGLGLNPPAEV